MAVDSVAPPIWAAAPPEVHSTLLTTGATAAGMTAAGVSWTHLSAEYIAAMAELEGIIASIQATYQGPSAEQFVMAHQPMLLWLADVAAKSEFAAASHAEIVAAYEGAVVAMPTMGELFENHFVHGVLIGTNFFGVNTIPIGMNEADYQRMWQLAADVMMGWDGASTMSANSIPPTPMSPMTMMLGVGEAGSSGATSASSATLVDATAGGVAMRGAGMMSDTLLAGKAAGAPATVANDVPGSTSQAQQAANQQDNLTNQATNPQNMMGQVLQQAASVGPEAVQSIASGPGQLLTSAPQQLASAPQQLSSLLGQFGGSGANAATQGAVPIGFAGTSALRGFNPAGLTSMAGGAFGSGPAKPMMPSTWGAQPITESAANTARAITPVATGMPGGAGASGSNAGGGAMGSGAHTGRGSTKKVHTYADDAVDEDADADSDGGAYVTSRR
jgi:PPE-repeat protein